MIEQEYGGASLRFVRQLVGAPARWGSAKAAAAELTLSMTTPPPLGAVCFYGSFHWGHCGLYVCHDMALTVDMDGEPRLFPYDSEHYWDGPFLGWISGPDFVLASTAVEAGHGRG